MKKLVCLVAAFACLVSTAYPQELKQSTATTVRVILANASTGAAITGITITNLSIRKIKHSDTTGATTELEACAASGTDHDCVEIANGIYEVEIPADNVGTLGRFDVCPVYTTTQAVPYCRTFMVVAAASYEVNVEGNVADGAGLSTDIAAVQADTDNIQTRIPAALVSGRIDASAGAIAANAITATAINADAITAAKVAADVGTEIRTGLLTVPKNTAYANFPVTFFAATGVRQTGLSTATITCNVFLDGAAANAVDDTTEVELDALNAPGVYVLNLTAAETNGDSGILVCKTGGGLVAQANFQTQR